MLSFIKIRGCFLRVNEGAAGSVHLPPSVSSRVAQVKSISEALCFRDCCFQAHQNEITGKSMSWSKNDCTIIRKTNTLIENCTDLTIHNYSNLDVSRPKINVFNQSKGTCIRSRQLPKRVRYAERHKNQDVKPKKINCKYVCA